MYTQEYNCTYTWIIQLKMHINNITIDKKGTKEEEKGNVGLGGKE